MGFRSVMEDNSSQPASRHCVQSGHTPIFVSGKIAEFQTETTHRHVKIVPLIGVADCHINSVTAISCMRN